MSSLQISRARLYLALYVRDGVPPHSQRDDRYHWALLEVRRNSSQATRFHARDYFNNPTQTHWIYEEINVSARGTPKLLAQMYIGDVVDDQRLCEILRDAPVLQESGWNCLDWVSGAMEMVWEDAILEGGTINEWEMLRTAVLRAADTEVERREGIVRALL
jgi:hypothetical protein